MKKILVLILCIFIFPVKAIELDNVKIKVGSYEFTPDNRTNYYILTSFRKQEIHISVEAPNDVEVIADEVVELTNKKTEIPITLKDNNEELNYIITVTKKDAPSNAIDESKIKLYVNFQPFKLAGKTSHKYNIDSKIKIVNLKATIEQEGVEIIGDGSVELKDKETNVDIIFKTDNDELKYNITLIKKDMSNKKDDSNKIDNILSTIAVIIYYIIIIILLIMLWSLFKLLFRLIKKIVKKFK